MATSASRPCTLKGPRGDPLGPSTNAGVPASGWLPSTGAHGAGVCRDPGNSASWLTDQRPDRPQDPLLRHRVRRPQELGEQAHPQFFDHPADRGQGRIAAAGGGPVQGLEPGGGDPSNGRHVVGVGGQVAGQPVEAVEDGADVAENVPQAGAAGGGDPAGVDEGVELGADVAGGGGEGGVGEIAEANLDLVGDGQDPLDRGDHVQGGGGQSLADGVQQLPEPLLVPGGAAGRGDQVVGGGGEAVGEQVGGGAVAVAAQGELGLVGLAGEDELHR